MKQVLGKAASSGRMNASFLRTFNPDQLGMYLDNANNLNIQGRKFMHNLVAEKKNIQN